jgi:hypothetical protein
MQLQSVAGTVDGVAEGWLDDVVWAASLRPAEITHANGVKEIFGTDPFGRQRRASVQVDGSGSSCACVDYASGEIEYDGTDTTCRIGASSVVRDTAGPAPLFTLPAETVELDPFGMYTGQHTDGSGSMWVLFGPDDRVAAQYDTSAVERVWNGSEWYWQPDPDSFTRTWYLTDINGVVLREVVNDYASNIWELTVDFVRALGRLVGKAKRIGPLSQSGHLHPMGVAPTSAGSGIPLGSDF